MQSTFKSHALVVTVLVAMLGIAPMAVAHAKPSAATRSVVVKYDDLNLSSEAGAVRLYARLLHAAEKVCGAPSRPGTLIVPSDWKRCIRETVARSVAQVDRPALSAYHAERTGIATGTSSAIVARSDGRN